MNQPRSPSIVAGVVALLLFLALGAALIHFYIDKERQRDMQQWESRLGLVAGTRVDAIERWVKEQFSSLQELADNASLQLYLWQLSQRTDLTNQVAEPAQQTYLRNLILAAAERHGFISQALPRIPANLPQQQTTGLALLDHTLHPVVLTPGMPDIEDPFLQAARRALDTGKQQVSELVADSNSHTVLAFAVPVTAILGTTNNGDRQAVGVVLGVRNADTDLFPLLRQGASFAENSEALLLQQQGDDIVYLSPTADGGKPLRRRLPASRSDLASAVALSRAGDFATHPNYEGTPVLAVSRKIQGLPWVLVQQVNADQALQESRQRLGFLVTALSLLLLSIAALTVAAWRHGSSVRAQHQADELRSKALKLQKQTELLHAVTDNIDTQTLLLSSHGELLFLNRPVARTLGAEPSELIGKSLTSILGPVAARELALDIQACKDSNQPVSRILQLQHGRQRDTYQTTVVPIERVGEHQKPLLVVLNNITELQNMQARHEKLLRNLVSTLVHIVDLHDPYSAHHSSRMAEVANVLGRELRLSASDRQTLDLAATLSNLGKIMVPKEVLTKKEPLSEAEHELLKKHVEYGLELLENLNFDGPVLATIAQKQEHLDGSGYPAGLTDEQMSMTGKILSVANAFVALVSPRAYRKGIAVEEALDQLMKEAGTKYDRHVIAALFHIAENRADWSEWNINQD